VKLISYRSALFTPDTRAALTKLGDASLSYEGLSLKYTGVPRASCSWEGVEKDPGPTGLPAPVSMRPTGREVYLTVEGAANPVDEVTALWGMAVPLGFIPWDRYPLPSATSHVFHYVGPWASVGEFLQGEGRGEMAWPSMCAAAQCDAEVWEGDRLVERKVQTHLHRLGVHCGPVDGTIGPITLGALKALGVGHRELSVTQEALAGMEAPRRAAFKRAQGHLVLNDVSMEAFTSGGVHTVRTHSGYSVTVDGPGRLILMVGD
jgi:hypothetical protein